MCHTKLLALLPWLMCVAACAAVCAAVRVVVCCNACCSVCCSIAYQAAGLIAIISDMHIHIISTNNLLDHAERHLTISTQREFVTVACKGCWYSTIVRDNEYSMRVGQKELIERTPPSWGGFLLTMFPDQEPEGRRAPSKHLVQILRGGSSSSGFLIREHSE